MLIPRYYFSGEYTQLYDYFLSQPHSVRTFHKGDYIWKPDEYIQKTYFILSGICVTSATHEDGYQKILYFHSVGSVFPGFHQSNFKIEKSLTTTALSDMDTLEFSRDDFYRMFQENQKLSAIAFESYAKYINLLIYETAHQEYNNSFIKLCNLLYLFSQNSPSGSSNHIDLTQENIADILTLNRVNVAKSLSRLRDEGIIISHRKWIEISDLERLRDYCSHETLDI
ncbi:Crp/Fnr family transcriptional regulator [Faecalicatena sp. AGMB00832]|uniref:Crp/Fnr family transcriptional regulator n=1 Tax=Faecalicatena faecalis TaxID=2726362 RepID=A0ABS6D2L8_9FIRM|nr:MULTISPECIES: Crp/Fnr family transcriptional regulator [Faecalicatena]MBU3875426.1 Crp/Fnr family transcriptional regulator [Faecalicatena faecalis]MCI6468031.1 Crp/Fnr family transcriptional regulator [Faecalicatena sp.]MDY5618508.1 Crp/Fnr family transcriptional regulator [Lachnospiraceae bacterium]